MKRILTVTFNPALDITTAVDVVVSGRKLRCDAPRIDPGGGGVNVSRAIAQLGRESIAFAAIGGAIGSEFRERLEREGIDCVWFEMEQTTRQSLAVHDREMSEQFRFVLPGPVWSAADWRDCLRLLRAQFRAGDIVVVSGSLPPGVPPDAHRVLAELLSGSDTQVIADTNGPALAAIASGTGNSIHVLVTDEHEAARLLEMASIAIADARELAVRLVSDQVARNVLITLGPRGVLAADEDGVWFVTPPDVEVVSKVGAGDSFVAGLAIGLAQGQAMPESLKYAMGAATSAVTTPGTELCELEGTERYSQLSVCQRLT
jgi:6-phosphofructokinase 2